MCVDFQTSKAIPTINKSKEKARGTILCLRSYKNMTESNTNKKVYKKESRAPERIS